MTNIVSYTRCSTDKQNNSIEVQSNEINDIVNTKVFRLISLMLIMLFLVKVLIENNLMK